MRHFFFIVMRVKLDASGRRRRRKSEERKLPEGTSDLENCRTSSAVT